MDWYSGECLRVVLEYSTTIFANESMYSARLDDNALAVVILLSLGVVRSSNSRPFELRDSSRLAFGICFEWLHIQRDLNFRLM